MPVEISVAEIYAMWIAGELVAQGANTVCARRKEVRTGAMTQVRRKNSTNAQGAEVETGESTSANRGPGDQSGRKRKKERVRNEAHHRCPKKEMATTGGDSQSMPTLRL